MPPVGARQSDKKTQGSVPQLREHKFRYRVAASSLDRTQRLGWGRPGVWPFCDAPSSLHVLRYTA